MTDTPSKFRIETFGDSGVRVVEVRFQSTKGPPYKVERRGEDGWYETFTHVHPDAWHNTTDQAWASMERQQVGCVEFHQREWARAVARLENIQKMRSEHG